MSRSVNVQAWLPAQTVAAIAKYMEMTGYESRQLSAVTQIATQVLGGILKNKGISFDTEADALRYLLQRGFAVATRKDTQKKVVEALQEEALLEVTRDDRRATAKKALEEVGI